MARPARKSRDPEETEAKLLAAAEREFNTRGYFGTDTNRIARAAGYAPQTFYRHFPDKTAIFLAVYDGWWRAERTAIADVARGARGNAALERIADTAIGFHTRWRIFRRSLRHLAVEDPRVRAARAEARLKQIESLERLPRKKRRSRAELAAALLTLERLCDAAAENEFSDMAFSAADARRAVIAALRTTHGGE